MNIKPHFLLIAIIFGVIAGLADKAMNGASEMVYDSEECIRDTAMIGTNENNAFINYSDCFEVDYDDEDEGDKKKGLIKISPISDEMMNYIYIF